MFARIEFLPAVFSCQDRHYSIPILQGRAKQHTQPCKTSQVASSNAVSKYQHLRDVVGSTCGVFRASGTFSELGNKRAEEQTQALSRTPQPTSRQEEQKERKDVLDLQEKRTHQRRLLVEPRKCQQQVEEKQAQEIQERVQEVQQ